MKEIWINLELYIKRYDFYKLGNFFGFLNYFYYFIFDFKPIFLNKNIKKWARDPRGCDVARKATWQRHADPRSAPTWRVYVILFI